jgi:hypothetical protein
VNDRATRAGHLPKRVGHRPEPISSSSYFHWEAALDIL